MADDKEIHTLLIDEMTVTDNGHKGEFVAKTGDFSAKGHITCEDGTIIDDEFITSSVFDAYNNMKSTDSPTEDNALFELDMTAVQLEVRAMPLSVKIDKEIVEEFDRHLVIEDISPMSAACAAAKNKDGQER